MYRVGKCIMILRAVRDGCYVVVAGLYMALVSLTHTFHSFTNSFTTITQGQVFILDSLAKYTPADAREAEGIIERVTPRLQHANRPSS